MSDEFAEFTIGQLAKEAGVETFTLRYYERVGLPQASSPNDAQLLPAFQKTT